jgi:hypothetical protein
MMGSRSQHASLCATNLAYPDANGAAAGQGNASGRPHAPTSICGFAPTYDANGNTLTYDPDAASIIIALLCYPPFDCCW